MTDKKKLIIIRGPVGTGKTTMAKAILAKYPEYKHLEVDMVFTDKDGGYHFNLLELGKACEWCATTAEQYMNEGHSLVVSNPFSQIWEMEIYFMVAKSLDYEITLMDCMTFFGNPHNVEQKVIDAQRERWESAEIIQQCCPYIKIVQNPNTEVRTK